MKRTVLLSALILALGHLQAKVIFVSEHGEGDGSSWAAALSSLHSALQQARAGDQVWVSSGTYRTSENNDRSKSFAIPAGVQLFGGFAGFETAPEQRKLDENATYLSGEIGTFSNQDNAFTVVYTENAGANTIVDGFHITGGAANGSDPSRLQEIRGAGWYNLATEGQTSSPLIRNCIFVGNMAKEGGAILNLAMKQGACLPAIINCIFLENKAGMKGGAIMNISIEGNSSPEINSCLFEANQASYGACIFNEPWGGTASPAIRECTFRNNTAYVRNASIHNEYSGGGSCQPILEKNHFEGNGSSVGQEKNSAPTKVKQASGSD